MLSNKVVVITGACGGLGSELVKQFLAEGSVVVALARSQLSLDKMAQALNTEKFHPHVVDVSNSVSVKQCFELIARDLGGVDILFNNAAVYPRLNFLDESPEEWMNAIAINLGGVANCCKAALPQMLKKGFGRVYNLGSFADLKPIENSSAYSCSKGGLHSLTKAIARDVDALNKSVDIEIHEWIPGHLKTQMSNFTGIEPTLSASWGVKIARGDIKAGTKHSIFVNDRERLPPRRL
ncbi:MAG: SDR family oxidoreductase, partial [Cyclobacteriaceae bacterium]|nr:SDR family oxidoreductase [Cyclobacteriaceae bacterium]